MMLKIFGLAAALLTGPIVHANVVGADTQNFNPTNDGLDFVTVHSSKTLTPGLLNFGFFLNYAVNSLPNYEDRQTQTRTNFDDSLFSADMNVALGLTPKWQIGLSLPMLLSQTVDSDVAAFRGEFANNGLTEMRAMTKYNLLADERGGLATVVSANFNQIQDNPFTGEDAGPTFNFELAADRAFGKYAVGANIGYRLRDPGARLAGVPIDPLGNQYIASLAVSYLVEEWDTKVIGEVFGSFPAEEGEFISDRDASSAELLLGLKTDLTPSLAFHMGGGTEIVHGTSSPDWRVYSGLNWVIGPIFSREREVFVRIDEQTLKPIEDADAFSGSPELNEAFIARDVLFEFNSDQLQPGAIEALTKLVDYLKRPPGYQTLAIEGHTDSVGVAVYNLDLSRRRAARVRSELVRLGLEAAKVRSQGFGESRPIANNGNYQGRALNRRVEFRVRRATGTETL